MIITFAQYSLLTAAQRSATYRQLEQKTNFDQLMVDYYIMGLINIGLIKATDENRNEHTRYELTESGEQCLDEYERANPDLVIKTNNDSM